MKSFFGSLFLASLILSTISFAETRRELDRAINHLRSAAVKADYYNINGSEVELLDAKGLLNPYSYDSNIQEALAEVDDALYFIGLDRYRFDLRFIINKRSYAAKADIESSELYK